MVLCAAATHDDDNDGGVDARSSMKLCVTNLTRKKIASSACYEALVCVFNEEVFTISVTTFSLHIFSVNPPSLHISLPVTTRHQWNKCFSLNSTNTKYHSFNITQAMRKA